MVFQAYSLFPTMTARQNIEFGLRLRGMSKRERTTRPPRPEPRPARATAIGSPISCPAESSSGSRCPGAGARTAGPAAGRAAVGAGRKVRVPAAAGNSLDPVPAGDHDYLVTHDQEEAFSISDRVAVMSTGRVSSRDACGDLLGARKPFVAEFVGTMNRLDCRVCDDDAIAFDSGGARSRLRPPRTAARYADDRAAHPGPKGSRSRPATAARETSRWWGLRCAGTRSSARIRGSSSSCRSVSSSRTCRARKACRGPARKPRSRCPRLDASAVPGDRHAPESPPARRRRAPRRVGAPSGERTRGSSRPRSRPTSTSSSSTSRWSADGALVVTHDPTELTLAQIRRLQPEMPTLDEVLEQLRGRVALEVEVKNVPGGEPTYEPAGSSDRARGGRGPAATGSTDSFISSFDDETRALRLRARRRDPDRVCSSSRCRPRSSARALDRPAHVLAPRRDLARECRELVDRSCARARRYRSAPGRSTTPRRWSRLFELGVDAVRRSDPAMGVRVRDARTRG